MKIEQKVKFSNLTEKQREVIKKFMELEKTYGKGKVFIRYLVNYNSIMFILHEADNDSIDILSKYRIHGKTANSLEAKGLIVTYDISHRITEPNSRNTILVGARININKIDFGIKHKENEEIKKVRKDTLKIDKYDISNLRKIDIKNSSKGNQRKWFNEKTQEYIKEQFVYQGVRWSDYKVERLSYELSKKLNTLGVKVLEQRIVTLSNDKMIYGVVSKNFLNRNESFITMNRLLKNSGESFSENAFPIRKFRQLVTIVKNSCRIDITNYLIVMVIMDYILLNEDRHLNNFGVIRKENGEYRVAPLFDFGLGLFQHDRKYFNKSLEEAYELVEGKPFNYDMFSIISALSKNGYKEVINKIINNIKYFDVSCIRDSKAQEHVNKAINNLQRLVKGA